jgi:hypothetical protein
VKPKTAQATERRKMLQENIGIKASEMPQTEKKLF